MTKSKTAMKVLILPLLALLLPACSMRAPTTAGIDEKGELYYHGSLDAAANDALISAYEAAARKPRVLHVTSGGGSAHLGMDLGEWIHENGLAVHVRKGCASSCANYIFTAAEKKYLDRDSVLYWHGGAYQQVPGMEPRAEDLPSLEAWRQREDAFFERIGVDGRITVCGQPAQLYLNKSRDTPYVGFDYSIDDLRRFGVDSVEVTSGEWNWRIHHPDNEVLRAEVIGHGHDLRCVAAE